MAIEMLLKELLVDIHPALALENIDSPKKKTVSLRFAAARLHTFSKALTPTEYETVCKAADWRDDVAHRKFAATKQEATIILAKVFRVFSDLAKQRLKRDISQILPKKIYREFKEYLKSWDALEEEAYKRASAAAEKNGWRISNCPSCFDSDALVLKSNGRAYCYLCDQGFRYGRCSTCDEPVFENDGGFDFGMCDGCLDNRFAD